MSETVPDREEGLFDAVVRIYTRVMMAIGCTFLALIVIIMGSEVFFRYVLNNPILWAEQMSMVLLIWITFLFLGISYQRGELISLSLLLRRMPKAVHIVLTLIAHIVTLLTLGVLIWYGYAWAEQVPGALPAFTLIWQTIAGPDAELYISNWWLYMVVPVGAGLLAIHLAFGLVIRIRGILNDEPVYLEDMPVDGAGEGTR